MKRVTPIGIDGDGVLLHEAICQMFVRAAKMARKRPTPIDIAIGPESVNILVALQDYFTEDEDLRTVIERINKMF